MDKQLILIVCYINFKDYDKPELVAARFADIKRNVHKLHMELDDEMKEKYQIITYFMPVESENRIECIFPKEPDLEIKEKINELIYSQHKLFELCQQQQEQAGPAEV